MKPLKLINLKRPHPNIEKIYPLAATKVNPTMPMECVRIAIMPKEGQRRPINVNMQIGFYMPKEFAKIATLVFTINKREEPRGSF